ncbi:fibrocystin-L-like [Argopecten irradians]|uniref:fibrocystin-L-like n=1 Tax=Argopecten irradians TaxID=31199 RepID=UPI00371202E3
MLTLTGQRFTPETTVKVGSNDCDVTSTTDSEIICQISRTRNVHRVNNLGIHRDFGKYYNWNPRHLKVLVGDTVRWDWEFPFYITTMKPRIEETYNITTKYGKPGGFSSGSVGTTSGWYSHEFRTAGKFYYWSGMVDDYGTTWFHGSVEVEERTSYLADVTVTVGEYEATYSITGTGRSTPSTVNATCLDLTTNINDCTDSFPGISSNTEKFQFSFWTCRTPIVDEVSRQNGTTNDDIVLSGNGLSGVSCANEVTFGDFMCLPSDSSVSSVTCNIDPKNEPWIGRPQYADIIVRNLGYAHVKIESDFLQTFTLFPLVRSLSSTKGSRGGHTRLTISGTGFEAEDLGNSTDVFIGGYPCIMKYISYKEIVCITPISSSAGEREISIVVQTTSGLPIPAKCETSCVFVYDEAVTPTVTGVSPSSFIGDNITILSIAGTGFEEVKDNVQVTMESSEDHPCPVLEVSDSQITCSLTNLPVGVNKVIVDVSGKGRAIYSSGDVSVDSIATITDISPNNGSIYGGTDVTVTGNGFLSDVVVEINNKACNVKYRTISSIVFKTPSQPSSVATLKVSSNGKPYPDQKYTFTEEASPSVASVYPSSGTTGQNITITGSRLGSIFNQTAVFVGESECRIISIRDTEIICTVGYNRAGTYNVYVHVQDLGYSNDDSTFVFRMSADSISPYSGSLAGDQTVAILGTGFDEDMVVTICDRVCNLSEKFTANSSHYVCNTPSSSGLLSRKCTVSVTVNGITDTLLDSYEYDDSITSVIVDVTPRRGGTAGGTRITISGSQFGSQITAGECVSSVTISGTLCNITSWTEIQVVCVTEAHSRSERTHVRLETGCSGKADQSNAEFQFVDVWSSVYTWGGEDLGLPTDGDIVVIPAGQTILLDTDTPVLKMLVIQGGEVVFDDKDVELQAENILITDGGILKVGTEEGPFKHKAIITLHGNRRSKELPIYGTKALIVREGTLDLHGSNVPITWTRLAQTVTKGSLELKLENPVTWRIGDRLVISTTGGMESQHENEVVTIASVSNDNKILTLESPLTSTHLGISETVAEQELYFSAEVGLLTRNIVIRGFLDPQWIESVPACPDGFDPDFYAIQTCFQGRRGDEIISDQFGAQVIIHTTHPTKQVTTSRIEFVELFNVGQSLRYGRHPINFLMAGDMSKSYIRGCSIYDTFNRAINIRDTQNLLIEQNVLYNVIGSAIYLEQGTEIGNVFQYNLGVFVKGTSQLMNVDISPATFMISNPNNTFRHNAVAGGTHFGYWFQLENYGYSSFTSPHRPRYTPLAEFYNNTAHSLGWYGLWFSLAYTPRMIYYPGQYTSQQKVAVLDHIYVWNCRKGVEITDMGSVRIRNLIAVNNMFSGYEAKTISEGSYDTNDGPLVEDSMIVGYVSNIPSQGCTNGGVVSPYYFGFTVRNVSFVNFDQPDCSALAVTRIPELCTSHCGGYMYRTANLTFNNSDYRLSNDWVWESVYEDLDGSLCGTENCKVVPCTGTLPSVCGNFTHHMTGVPLCTCPPEVKLFRLSIQSYIYYIYTSRNYVYTIRESLTLTTQYGSTEHPYRSKAIAPPYGWMSNLVSGEEYEWSMPFIHTWTNISYDATFYRMQFGDHVKISQPLAGEPDRFRIDGSNLIPPTNGTLDPEIHYHGDWQYNETSGMITYLVSYRLRGYEDKNYGLRNINVRLRTEKCFFNGCVPPPPEPTVPTVTPGTDTLVYRNWSSPSSWPNNTLPIDMDDVTINKDTWMMADTVIPRLNKLVILGVLELDQGPVNGYYRNFTLSATDIIIIGGRLIIGTPSHPFLGLVDIVLRGSRPGYLDTEEYLPFSQIPVNSKTLGVYGGLSLNGRDVGITWTRLFQTGLPGDTFIRLTDSVTWGVGEEILIASTSYDIWETETFIIINVSDDGRTLSLNDFLKFRHIVHNETIGDREVVMSAEVGLLTRNIRLLGEDENSLYTDRYGGQVFVGANVFNNTYYQGYASLNNVEFYRTGQEYPYTNTPFSLVYWGVNSLSEDGPSYVTSCAFHEIVSSAIGLHNTNSLVLKGNVIHKSIVTAMETQSSLNTTIQSNLVVQVLGGSNRFGAISSMGSRELTLTSNTVSGTDGTAFHVPVVECGVDTGPSGNEAHTASVGVAVFPEDNLEDTCYQISQYLIWKCNGIGIYYNDRQSVTFTENVLAENALGIYAQVIGPSAVAHVYSPKFCTVKDSLIIGTTSSYNCSTDQMKSTGIQSQIPGGHVGMTFTSFMQGTNGAPNNNLIGIKTYPSIMGVTNVQDVTFAHFKTSCGTKDVMLTTNRANDDGQHPVVTRRITKHQSENDTYFFIHRPNVEKVNPSDCVDMDCDGLKKALISDEDGSFLGTKGNVISESEWEWNGDSRRGLGDYRIPKELLISLSGQRLNVSSVAPHKGIVRDHQCRYEAAWQAYQCDNLDYRMMIIESLDADTESRRLSPVAVLGDGYLDLINGPQDHSGCSYGGCRKRLSTFMSVVAAGKKYLLHFTTTSPQTLRLFLLNSDDSQVVTVGIWYSQSNRRDVYVGEQLVLAKNARMVNGKYIVDPPSYEGQFIPKTNSTDVTGTNFFDRDSNTLYVLVRGNRPVKIVTNPTFIVSFQIPALTSEEFYGEALIHNLALFFNVPPEKVRIVNVVRESGRRKRQVDGNIEVQFEIGDPPAANANSTTDEALTKDSLLDMSSKLINEVQGGGDLSAALNVSVSGVAVSEPLPEVPEDGSYTIEDSEGQITIPQKMNVTIQPGPSHETVPFPIQPCLKFYDQQNQPMSKVGSIGDPWRVTASLISGGDHSAQLLGTTTVNIVSGWANFTDLSISHFGEDYVIYFNKTYPDNNKTFSVESERISVSKLEVGLQTNISTGSKFINNVTEVRITLTDYNTGQRLNNISWRGHTWTATAKLLDESDRVLNVSDVVILDPDTGEAVFDSLVVDQIGFYFLTFQVTSSPEEYNVNKTIQIQVLTEEQLTLIVDNTTTVTNISLRFNANYQNVVGDKEDNFGAMVVNVISQQFPDVVFDSITVREGSIVVELVMRSQAEDTNATLELLDSVIQLSDFSFNDNPLTTPLLSVNGVDVSAVTTTPTVTTTIDTTTPPVTTTTVDTTTPAITTTTVDTTTPAVTTTTVDTTTPVVTTTTVDTTTPVVTTTTVDTTTPAVTTTTVDTTTPAVTTTTVDTTTPAVTTTTVDTTTQGITTKTVDTTTPAVTTTTVDTTTPAVTTTTVDATTHAVTTTTVDTTTPAVTTTSVDTTTPAVTTTAVDTTTPAVTTTAVDTTTPAATTTTVDTTTPAVTTTVDPTTPTATTSPTFTMTPIVTSTTVDTTTPTVTSTPIENTTNTSYKLSFVELVMVVSIPTIVFAIIIIVFLSIKCWRVRKQKDRKMRKTPSVASEDSLLESHDRRRDRRRGEYSYQAPFNAKNDLKPNQQLIPRLQTSAALRSIAPSQWGSTDNAGYQWVSADNAGRKWNPVDNNGHQWGSADNTGRPMSHENSNGRQPHVYYTGQSGYYDY